MRRTLAALVAFALLGTFGVQTGWGLPVQSVSMLEAVDCCAGDCAHAPRAPSLAGRCCGIEDAQPAVSSSPGAFPVAAVVAFTAATDQLVEETGRTVRTPHIPPRSRGAPLFLVNQSFLI